MSQSKNRAQAFRKKRDALYQEALADQNSQAAEMVRMLLLPGVSSLQPEAFNQDPDVLLGQERRRSRSVREARKSAAETEEPLAAEGTPQSEEWKRRLDEVVQAVKDARAQQMTPLQVYNRIFEIVGLRTPADEERENRQADGGGGELDGRQ